VCALIGEEDLEAVRRANALLSADLRAEFGRDVLSIDPLSLPPDGPSRFESFAHYVVYLALYVFQPAVLDDPDPSFGGLPFPTCPLHGYDAMGADVVDGVACWVCSRQEGPTIPIGSLQPCSTDRP
jgi:hypothetical protein